MDATTPTLMALRVSPDYAAWWTTMYPGPLVLDESNDSDGEVSQPSEDDDPMQVDNPIHDGPSQGGDIIGGLDVLAVIALALGKEEQLVAIL